MKVAYYPGCTQRGTAEEFGHSTEAACEALGIELAEIPDWNCCGATSAHALDHALAIALPARDLAQAESMGLDTVTTSCAACYARLQVAHQTITGDPERWQPYLAGAGIRYRGTLRIYSLLDLIANVHGLEPLQEKVVRPLDGLRLACYYGCLLVRPPEIAQFDDPELPMSMDHLIEALGGMPVPWAYKTECCGAALAMARGDIQKKNSRDVLQNAADHGAEGVVVACPLCHGNLDWYQEEINGQFGTELNMPVYFFTQLVAVCCGQPLHRLGLEAHLTPCLAPLEAKGVLG